MELKTINKLSDEIDYLKKKAQLADEFLRYYDAETMNVDVPVKWKNAHRLSFEAAQKTPASPRHSLALKIAELLPYDEARLFENNEMHSTLK